jgi:hypothetical protein
MTLSLLGRTGDTDHRRRTILEEEVGASAEFVDVGEVDEDLQLSGDSRAPRNTSRGVDRQHMG